jgi:hypothetical protein
MFRNRILPVLLFAIAALAVTGAGDSSARVDAASAAACGAVDGSCPGPCPPCPGCCDACAGGACEPSTGTVAAR